MALTRKEIKSRYIKNNREKVNAAHKAWIDKRKTEDPAWFKTSTRAARLRKYGLTQADFERMWNAQNGQCAICREPFKDQLRACVDHDHATGFVRDLLCRPCNVDLAVVDDDDYLAKLLSYRDVHCQRFVEAK